MKNFLLIIALSLLVSGCYYDKAQQLYPNNTSNTTCDTTSVTYSGTIAPIISQYCSIPGCHDATTLANGYDFTKYSGVALPAYQGRLLGSINQESGYLPMPQGLPKLPQCDIDKITAWVNAGYPNN